MNSPLRTRLGAFVAVAALLCSAGHALGQETLAKYDFSSSSVLNTAVTSPLANATGLTLTGGGNRSATTAGPDTVAGSYARTGSTAIADNLSAALSGNSYLTFSLTPTTSALNYLSLDFAFGASNNTSSADPYVANWALLTSSTGFTASDVLATNSYTRDKLTGVGASWINPNPSVNLSGVSNLQNAAVGQAIEFRLYFWDSYSGTTTSNLVIRFDDISVTAAAIPEPSTYAALIGLAALGFVALRRRQARSA